MTYVIAEAYLRNCIIVIVATCQLIKVNNGSILADGELMKPLLLHFSPNG